MEKNNNSQLLNKLSKEELIQYIIDNNSDKNINEYFEKKNTSNNIIETKTSKTIKKVDFSKQVYMAFKFMYLGKNYDGLVIQKDTKNTIEEHIFLALKKASLI